MEEYPCLPSLGDLALGRFHLPMMRDTHSPPLSDGGKIGLANVSGRQFPESRHQRRIHLWVQGNAYISASADDVRVRESAGVVQGQRVVQLND